MNSGAVLFTSLLFIALISRVSVVAADTSNKSETDWRTPTEISGYKTTPDNDETMAYVHRLVAAAPDKLKLETFGKSGEGRDLDIVIASKDGVFDPVAIRASHRPILLVQNGIHAGEADGKDACLALLRDMVITKKQEKLLDRAVFVMIPFINPDGHARRSKYNRINQDGPEENGWRANASNLNLNRDYMKLDTPELRALMDLFHHWKPDFFVDDHVSDGADFQYDTMFTFDAPPTLGSEFKNWANEIAIPTLVKGVNESGHKTSPYYVLLLDDNDPAKGIVQTPTPPRFSTGYVNLENRPAMLVEMHSRKDYKTRVTGNFEILRVLLGLINRDADALLTINAKADADAEQLGNSLKSSPPKLFPIAYGVKDRQEVMFEGYHFEKKHSEIAGGDVLVFTKELWNQNVPIARGEVIASLVPPEAYIIPREWTHVIDVLEAHHVELERTTAPWTGEVETYQCNDMIWHKTPFEGRHPIMQGEGKPEDAGKFGKCVPVRQTMTFPAGSVIVSMNQRLSKVALNWLEPMAPDSALRWCFFDSIFEQKEDGDPDIAEKLAEEMIAADPKLKAEFDEKLRNDKAFAADTDARLDFFYQRSPWGKQRVGLYPVGRLSTLDGLPR